MERKKLTLMTNLDHEVEFLFDNHKEGEKDYGTEIRKWYLYGVKHDGEEKSLFPSEALHEKLRSYRKGDKVNIRKDEVGDHIEWNVTLTNGSTPSTTNETDWDAIKEEKREYAESQNKKRSKDIHRQVALKLAVETASIPELDMGVIKKRMKTFLAIIEEDDLPF